MASASDFVNSPIVKALYLGDSGTGKTGSILSLVQAGYKIRMIDLDAGIGTLIQLVRKFCPENLGNIQYQSPRDRYKQTPSGVVVAGAPKAFIDTMNCLEKWPDDGSNPAEWGPEYILVLDSLTALGRAAYAWFDALNPGVKEKRQIYFTAQNVIERCLTNITAESFNTNVLVLTHVKYDPTRTKGFPTSVGSAQGDTIGSLFNNMILAEQTALPGGSKVSRSIRTSTNGIVGLKNERSFDIPTTLPLETGLATFFAQLKGE